MKSTFHEVELGKAVVQNATEGNTEQLIVTLPAESRASVQIEIKQNTNGKSTTSGTIEITQHGLQQLFEWLREEEALR